jgi:DNA mismatch endonuclease (patch repair protein)
MMKAVKQTNTGAELEVRKLVTALGSRYRLGNRDLPGSPDLANRTKRWAVFVNGCFWHGHKNCPKTKGGGWFTCAESEATLLEEEATN